MEVVFEENNGKLVLISGPLVVSDPLQDATYEVSINAVKLRKVVQVTENFIFMFVLSFFLFFFKGFSGTLPLEQTYNIYIHRVAAIFPEHFSNLHCRIKNNLYK